MSVELRPLGVRCNIVCQYCYQNPQRDAGNVAKRYDLEAMKRAVLEEGGPFTLFGGEPLIVPEEDLEALWSWGLEQFGRNGIQTNGTLINEAHVRMFKRYRVHVGISIDGPGELNDARWAGSLENTRAQTAKTETAIERLCREGIPPSLIVTLHRGNATADKLPAMHDWLRRLDRMGIRSARLHMLESENRLIRDKYALDVEENIRALMSFAELEDDLWSIELDVFNEVAALLRGKDKKVSCVWRACDPYTTHSVRGVEGFGNKSNCGRTNKDGIDFLKADRAGHERYLALYHTPQEAGGCQGCRFFLMCKGQCPGTALQGDWRNRTEHCDIWMELFEYVEGKLQERGIQPLSLEPDLRRIEAAMLRAWEAGKNPAIEDLVDAAEEAPAAASA